MIPKIRTGTLPPLSITISGPGPRVQPRPSSAPKPRAPTPSMRAAGVRRKKKTNKMMMPATLLVAGGLASGVFLQYQNSQAAQKARTDSLAVADSLERVEREARTRGSRIIAGLPAGVNAIIDGKAYRNGDKFVSDTGTYGVQAKERGYDDLYLTFTITPGRTDTLTLTMHETSATPSTPQQQQQQTRQVAVVRAPTDSAEVRLSVMPSHADIFVDGTRIGSGRAVRRLPVGPHTVRYNAPDCETEDRSIMVSKDETQIVPLLTLQCR
ncbi:MAG: hypothetical protein E6H78_17845 [Betaproteobacteria bacterium]|nr:MAG: hypothetical protein E6H78_17845 [Betaproteobacteria bacterium]